MSEAAAGPGAPGRPIVEIRRLRREFGTCVAVDDLSLDVAEGEIFGFIGPNGAGKTTTIRILSTLLEPTSGEARIAGACVRENPEEVRRLIGYMPDVFGVYEGITVEEYLDFFAAAFRIPPPRRRGVVRDVLELTDLAALSGRLVSQLSRGMKQRLGLARCLVHDPKVLILDEPASSLDPRARIEMRELFKELRRMRKTVFISSHILTELSDLCTSVGIIERGRLLFTGDMEAIQRRRSSGTRVTIRLHRQEPAAAETLRGLPQVGDVEEQGPEVRFSYRGDPADFHEVVKALADRKVPILTIHEVLDDLERLFLEVTDGRIQ